MRFVAILAILLSLPTGVLADGASTPGVPPIVGSDAGAVSYSAGGIPPVGLCASDPYHAVDGCDGANANSNFIVSNIKSHAAEDGHALPYWPAWYLSGASDTGNGIYGYPVGYYTAKGSLQDPATATTGSGQGQLPSGCTYHANGLSTVSYAAGPILYCAGISSNFTLNGFDFGPVGSHTATAVAIAESCTGHITITNSNFENDSTLSSSMSLSSIYFTFPGLISFISNSLGATATVTVTFSSFQGHWTDSCCNMQLNASGWAPVGMAPIAYRGNQNPTHRLTIEYSNMVGFNGADVWYLGGGKSAFQAGDTGVEQHYNYIEGVESASPYGHSDGLFLSCGFYNDPAVNPGNPVASDIPCVFISTYQVVLQPGTASATGTGWFYQDAVFTSGTTGWADTNPYTIQNMTFLSGNYVTGATKDSNSFGGCVGASVPVVAHACVPSGSGNVFTWNGLGDTPQTGMFDYTFNESFSLGPQIDTNHWYINCTINGGTDCPHPYFYPSVSIAAASIPNNRVWYAFWSFAPLTPMDHGYFNNISFTNNYIDIVTDGSVYPWHTNLQPNASNHTGMHCLTPLSSSNVNGNINMRTGAAAKTVLNSSGGSAPYYNNNCGQP